MFLWVICGHIQCYSDWNTQWLSKQDGQAVLRCRIAWDKVSRLNRRSASKRRSVFLSESSAVDGLHRNRRVFQARLAFSAEVKEYCVWPHVRPGINVAAIPLTHLHSQPVSAGPGGQWAPPASQSSGSDLDFQYSPKWGYTHYLRFMTGLKNVKMKHVSWPCHGVSTAWRIDGFNQFGKIYCESDGRAFINLLDTCHVCEYPSS